MLIEHNPALAEVAGFVSVVAMNVLGMQKLQSECLIERNHHLIALHHDHCIVTRQQLGQFRQDLHVWMTVQIPMRVVPPARHDQIQTLHAERHGVVGHRSQTKCHHPWTVRLISPWVQPQLLLDFIWVMTIGALFDQQLLPTLILIVFLGIRMVGENPPEPVLLL